MELTEAARKAFVSENFELAKKLDKQKDAMRAKMSTEQLYDVLRNLAKNNPFEK